MKHFQNVSSKSFMNLPTIHTKLEQNGLQRRSKQLFKLKSKKPHPSCVIYEGVCVCEQTYLGQTRRNVELRWEEPENTSKDSEPAKHLKENFSYTFSWKILFVAPENKRIPKILEASEIALKRPHLNEQIESEKLLLFCNGVT